jgi:hypothetical protein
MAQLSYEIHQRSTSFHDVIVVRFRGAFWYIRHTAEIQHPVAGAATVFLRFVYDQLGTVQVL